MPPVSPLDWLQAAQGRGIVPGLDRMERVLSALGNPERSLRCLHVAGTNGKGSVCAFAESVLRGAGCRTGLYTSPHLLRFSERIRINGEEVGEDLMEAGIERLRIATGGWDATEMPTYFELVTALAFDLFARAGLDAVMLETGLGGRLDATNTAPKLACAITSIGLDHTEWLGETLEDIAREKAGIFRPGIPIVAAPQEKEVLSVLKSEANRLKSPFRLVEESIGEGIALGLRGSHQRRNAALARALVHAAGFSPDARAISAGLGAVSWPGRFQRLVHRGREVILDGAHNPHAARQLAAVWRAEFGTRPCTLVFGSLCDKDPGAMLAELLPLASRIFLVPVSSPRTADLSDEALWRIFTGYSHPVPTIHASLGEAFGEVFSGEAVPEGPVLVAGSLFLVAEALALLAGGCFAPRIQ